MLEQIFLLFAKKTFAVREMYSLLSYIAMLLKIRPLMNDRYRADEDPLRLTLFDSWNLWGTPATCHQFKIMFRSNLH